MKINFKKGEGEVRKFKVAQIDGIGTSNFSHNPHLPTHVLPSVWSLKP